MIFWIGYFDRGIEMDIPSPWGRLRTFPSSLICDYKLTFFSRNHAYIFMYHTFPPCIFSKANPSSLAAPDTASVALRAILINLVRNRNVYNEVMAELTGLKLSNPATWKELAGAPLLHAIVKETIRLHPPAGFNLPRAVPAGGRTLCGYYLPEGTTVGMSAWCVHANEDFWGKDTLEFKPERWLDPERAFKLDQYGLSFGQGARACLGKNIALVQLVKVYLSLLYLRSLPLFPVE
ncbi:cytochrome P450 [Tuber indicum]|nr:cytochrome P450 [Tuber indicum]